MWLSRQSYRFIQNSLPSSPASSHGACSLELSSPAFSWRSFPRPGLHPHPTFGDLTFSPLLFASQGLKGKLSADVGPLPLPLAYLSAIFSPGTAPGTIFFNHRVYTHLVEAAQVPRQASEIKGWELPPGQGPRRSPSPSCRRGRAAGTGWRRRVGAAPWDLQPPRTPPPTAPQVPARRAPLPAAPAPRRHRRPQAGFHARP